MAATDGNCYQFLKVDKKNKETYLANTTGGQNNLAKAALTPPLPPLGMGTSI